MDPSLSITNKFTHSTLYNIFMQLLHCLTCYLAAVKFTSAETKKFETFCSLLLISSLYVL